MPNEKQANTGAPALPGAPVAPLAPASGSNPVLIEQPGVRAVYQPDAGSNPATMGTFGSTIAPNPDTSVAQTTINTDTTTIHPEASINNPVKPDGSPAPLKKAEIGPAGQSLKTAAEQDKDKQHAKSEVKK